MVSLLPQHWTTLWMVETNSQLLSTDEGVAHANSIRQFSYGDWGSQVRPLVLVIDTTYRSLHQGMEVKTGSFDIFI